MVLVNEKDLLNAIVNSDNSKLTGSPLYWYAKLDFNKDVSHPEYKVVEDKVKSDLKVIKEYECIKNAYLAIGLDIENKE